MFSFFKKKPDSNPRGVPLGELALMLSTGTIKASIEGSSLLAKHEHFTTKVEVLPPDPGAESDEPIRAVVRLTTELPRPLQAMMKGRELESTSMFNPMAALGALTIERSKVFVGSRLTIFERENAWHDLHLPLLLFTIIGGAPAILGSIRRTLTHESKKGGVSDWTADDFEHLKQLMSRFCVCSTSGLGFTAEFGLEAGATTAAMSHHKTALFQMFANQPHPEVGGGLFAILQLPHRLPSAQRVQELCAQLNLLEMAATDSPPHFGAWCPGRSSQNIAYVSFLPNPLHATDDIAMNVTMWAMHRATWANVKLAEMGVRD